MRRAAKRDVNHAEVQQAMERCGWETLDMSAIGRGVPDILGRHRATNRWTWVEVKRPGAYGRKAGRKRNETMQRQADFASRWPVVVIERVEQVVEL